MDHDPWLVKEVRRLTSDLHRMKQDLELVPLRYPLGFTDVDGIVVLGETEWGTLVERVDDARAEIVVQLNDFIENEFRRQLHWSALRMLTASGVLTTELTSFHGRLAFVAANPSTRSDNAGKLAGWFKGQILPIGDKLSSRLLQMIARVLDPDCWELRSGINTAAADGSMPTTLAMSFRPNTEERVNKQREKERQLRIRRVD